MAMTPGYWQSTYWTNDYWHEDFWQDAGDAAWFLIALEGHNASFSDLTATGTLVVTGNATFAGNVTVTGDVSAAGYNLMAYENETLFYENEVLTYAWCQNQCYCKTRNSNGC